MGSAMQVGRKARSPCDGASIAASVRPSADRSLYKIDRLQRRRSHAGRRRGLGADTLVEQTSSRHGRQQKSVQKRSPGSLSILSLTIAEHCGPARVERTDEIYRTLI